MEINFFRNNFRYEFPIPKKKENATWAFTSLEFRHMENVSIENKNTREIGLAFHGKCNIRLKNVVPWKSII